MKKDMILYILVTMLSLSILKINSDLTILKAEVKSLHVVQDAIIEKVK